MAKVYVNAGYAFTSKKDAEEYVQWKKDKGISFAEWGIDPITIKYTKPKLPRVLQYQFIDEGLGLAHRYTWLPKTYKNVPRNNVRVSHANTEYKTRYLHVRAKSKENAIKKANKIYNQWLQKERP